MTAKITRELFINLTITFAMLNIAVATTVVLGHSFTASKAYLFSFLFVLIMAQVDLFIISILNSLFFLIVDIVVQKGETNQLLSFLPTLLAVLYLMIEYQNAGLFLLTIPIAFLSSNFLRYRRMIGLTNE